MSACYDTNVCTFSQYLGLTQLKHLIFGSKVWPLWPSKTQVNETFIIRNSNGGSLCLVIITWVDDNHSGKHSHHANVFENLMRGAIFPKRYSCV